jgi:hypothetical protein
VPCAEKVCPDRFLQIGEKVERVCFTFSAFARFERKTGICLLLGESADLEKPHILTSLLFSVLPEKVIAKEVLIYPKDLIPKLWEAINAAMPTEELESRLAKLTEEINEVVADMEWGKEKEEKEEKDSAFDWLTFMANGAAMVELSPKEFMELTPAQFSAMKYHYLKNLKAQFDNQKQHGRPAPKELDFDSLLARMPKAKREAVNGHG